MATPKMLILRGNSFVGKGSNYPDEKGEMIEWPIGTLHVQAASDYARRRGYIPVVLDKPGQPQNQQSPQAKAALKAFLDDEAVTAFYGFSGGGYNMRHVLDYLASHKPETLHRITLVVIIGSPMKRGKHAFMPADFNPVARRKVKQWQNADWEVVYRENPKHSQMPKDKQGISTHMFGPDVLLSGWPEGT